MSSSADNSEPAADELADLSALADGTLDPERRAAAEARIGGSSELSALYAQERSVVQSLHDARARDRAPAALRARIEAARTPRRPASLRRVGFGGALAAAVAAAVLALVLLPAGTPGAPSVSQAAGIAVRGAAQAAPAPDARQPAKLGKDVQDVYFPNWSKSFGWRAAGQRSDRLHGRLAVTVYYRLRGQTIAYTIVTAPALSQPSARVANIDGTVLRTLTLDGRLVVTWRRAGHTCVLSGVGVSAAELQKLAAWKAPGIIV
jgi:hypothetical protein